MIKKLLSAAAMFGLVASMSASQPALADFPERNIQNIFPWGPGSAMAVSQIIAEAMGEELDVNISVVSTPGAAGVKAFKTAMNKPADGYTLIDGYVAPLVLQPLLGNADWTHKDFIPLHAATANAFAIVSRRDETRWKDLDGLIDYMKKNPGKLRYSTGSRGNLPHMVLAKVMQSADVVARNVPYNKNGDAIKDLHGGVLDFMFHNPGHYKANKEKSKPLAVLSDNADASAIYDGAPLVGDLGYDIGLKGLSPTGWNWWLVRKDTPPEVVAKLRDAMAKTLARDDVRQKILNVGFVPTGYTSDQYDDVISKVRDDLSSAIDALQWEKDKLKSVR